MSLRRYKYQNFNITFSFLNITKIIRIGNGNVVIITVIPVYFILFSNLVDQNMY